MQHFLSDNLIEDCNKRNTISLDCVEIYHQATKNTSKMRSIYLLHFSKMKQNLDTIIYIHWKLFFVINQSQKKQKIYQKLKCFYCKILIMRHKINLLEDNDVFFEKWMKLIIIVMCKSEALSEISPSKVPRPQRSLTNITLFSKNQVAFRCSSLCTFWSLVLWTGFDEVF